MRDANPQFYAKLHVLVITVFV